MICVSTGETGAGVGQALSQQTEGVARGAAAAHHVEGDHRDGCVTVLPGLLPTGRGLHHRTHQAHEGEHIT